MGNSMEGGFRFLLAGIVLVALAFSLMSVWPVLLDGNPRPTQQQLQQTLPSFPTPPPSSPNPSMRPAQPSTPNHPPHRGLARPALPPGLVANAQPTSIEIGKAYAWVYTKKRVILLKEPSGDPHRATSINHCELEIMAGTRLKSLRPEAGWVLVQSPSRLFGWVRAADVTPRPPATTDKHWALFPPN